MQPARSVSAPQARGGGHLEVAGLTVEFTTRHGTVRVVDDMHLEIAPGMTLGLVGESGSGKTMTARAIMGLVPSPPGEVGGSVKLDGRELIDLPQRTLSSIRGRDVGMIFQEPVRSLNPAYTVGDQIAEVVRRHWDAGRGAAWDRAVEMLDLVGIPDPARRARDFPHMFSGGMCQRAMLAIALACEPKLLIADEPTTALDVTVQAQVLRLIDEIQQRTGISVLLITHDLGIVSEMCDRIAVMYAGQIVETAPVDELFVTPRHPYTAGLLASVVDILVMDHSEQEFGSIRGSVPPPHRIISGCRFHPRCDHSVEGRCDLDPGPVLTELAAGRQSRCLRSEEIELAGIPERWHG